MPADDRLWLGASWYPEMWPETEWPKDLEKMRELGFNMVRVFEFAWHRFEPEEGRYNLDWARRVLDLCRKSGIAVMAGTPTAAPPAWMSERWPEILKTHAGGDCAKHGMRGHRSHLSAKYREFCGKIVSRMAEAFASHPALHSWQIDNEMSGQDFGPEARARFHQWLEKRYGSIEELNRRWGLEVWSQAYNRFAQIPLPTASVGSVEIPERHHPSLIFAAARFNNDEWSEYIRLQCEAIRKYSDKPITSNMTGTLAMHWYQHNRLLDRAGRSMYKDLKHYHWNLADFDRMRAEKPAPYWLLETAPNWSGGGRLWNIHHDARGVQLMSWMSTLLGGSMTLFWQWREHWAGPEMQHGTHLTATGKWRPNREAWARLANDYREQGPWLLAHPPARAQLALLLSNEAAWAFSIDPIDEGVRYEALWRDDYYLPLARAHLWRDVISEDHDFSSYRVLLCPLMPILKESTRRRLRDWVAKGGRLLLGPLAGYRTEEFTAFTDREFGGLEELIGGTSSIRFTPMWVEETVRVVFTKQAFGDSRGRAERSPTRIWCEGFAPENGKALAHYRGGYGDGHVAALENHPGRGCVITLGAPIRNELYLRLVLRLMKECGLAPLAEGGPDVLVVPRASPEGRLAGYGLANLTKKPQRLALPAGGRDRLTGRRIPRAARLRPLEVLLLETAGRNAGRRTV